MKRAAIAIGWEKTDFMRRYHDNTAFHNRLHQEIISETYPLLSQPQSKRDVSLDQRDAPDRHSHDADTQEWAQGAPPAPEPQYETWHAKGPIQ